MLIKLHEFAGMQHPLLVDPRGAIFEQESVNSKVYSEGRTFYVKESLEEIEILISQTSRPRRVLVTTHKETFEATFIQFCPYATCEGEAGLLCYYEKDDGQVDSRLAEMVKFLTLETGETV